ncbi:MAG: hypothetical protein AAGD25_25820 [Cyanobacteria bacterium P01_F01_bin.150]
MQLSPITSYYLRKLMRQKGDRLQPVSSTNSELFVGRTDTNLDVALQSLSQNHAEIGHITQKLEGLVSLHQALEKQGTIYSKDLASVEETIFQMLGFQLSSIL